MMKVHSSLLSTNCERSTYLDYLPDELINILFNYLNSEPRILCNLGNRYNNLYNMRIDNIKNGNIEPDDVFVTYNKMDFLNKFKSEEYDDSIMDLDLSETFNASLNFFVGNIKFYKFYINDEIVEYNNWKNFINECGLNRILYFYLTPTWTILGFVRFIIYKDTNKNYVYIKEQHFNNNIEIHVYINKRWKIIYNQVKDLENHVFLHRQGYLYKYDFDSNIYDIPSIMITLGIIILSIMGFIYNFNSLM